MKYAIIGPGRSDDLNAAYAVIKKLLNPGDTLLSVSGSEPGSSMEEKFAAKNNVPIFVRRANGDEIAKAMNIEMCDEADAIIAFLHSGTPWSKSVKGAKEVMCGARRASKPIYVNWT